MITVKSIYIGNAVESFIQRGLSDGVNIVWSVENHRGKTVALQGIMYALGALPQFPESFPRKECVFIVDVEANGTELSILRDNDTFVVKDSENILLFRGIREFSEFWDERVSPLPRIIKDGKRRICDLSIYTQMAFVPQGNRSTAKTSGYFNKKDFWEMLCSAAGLGARTLDTKAEEKLNARKKELLTRRKELLKQAKMLKEVGTSLAATSPTADREERNRLVEELNEIAGRINELRKHRAHAYTRKVKNEKVLKELNSLDREIPVGGVVCLDCGSERIGYKLPNSDLAFDITTPSMKSQIIGFVNDRITMHDNDVRACDEQIRILQEQFNAKADAREITLADIFSSRIDYRDYEEVDREISLITDELEDIANRLAEKARIDEDLRVRRAEFKQDILNTMSRIRREINNSDEVREYPDLFTTTTSIYSGSEESEFFIARACALVKHIHHGLPVIIDSFRAEELSTLREERALELFEALPNQVILSATLKQEESGKYERMEGIRQVCYDEFPMNKLLSEKWTAEFAKKVESFGISLF